MRILQLPLVDTADSPSLSHEMRPPASEASKMVPIPLGKDQVLPRIYLALQNCDCTNQEQGFAAGEVIWAPLVYCLMDV